MKIVLERGKRIDLILGDITRQEADAIVNAANSSLLGGGGVDGAIHQAGGPSILEECRAVRAARGPLPPGQAVATTAGRLRARRVIHTVGPIYQDGTRGEPDLLANCYREAIRLADELALATVAFPSISTGAFGYPVREAATIAMAAVRAGLLEAQTVMAARFVLFDEVTLAAYKDAAAEVKS